MPKKGVRKKARTIVKTVTTERYEPETESGLPDFKDFDSKTTRSKKGKISKTIKIKETTRNTSTGDTEKLLLENFIALQDALVNIGSDLKDLNKKITSMLELFENASKAYEEKPESRSLSNKLNEIIEQNQTIAKSIILLSKKFKEEKEGKQEKFEFSGKMNEKMADFEGFKPSIKSSQEEESSETDESDDSGDESPASEESTQGESGDGDDEFKPEPLPDFNF
jgi:hypothetical protein